MMTQQIGKLKPNTDLNQQSTNIYSVTMLQRIDPFIEEILITIAQVTFYQFNLDLHQWNRKDVEGPLFVVKRNAQPRFQFIVMSRRNTDNLVEDLLGDFEYDVQAPYLLYRNAAQEVNGIWFYNELECEAVANLFSRILNAYSKVPPKPKVSSTKSVFEELEAVPTVAVIEGSVEPPTSSAATSPDDSFLNFFVSAAMIGGNTANTAIPGQPHHPPLPTQQPSLSLPAQPTPLMPVLETIESSSRPASLVKPSLFASPPSSSAFMMAPITSSSSTPNAPPIHPPVTMQHGSPLLQPFPPPSPSPSLTPNNAPVITRDGVRDALLRLVQNNQFIDMVYREMLNAHNP